MILKVGTAGAVPPVGMSGAVMEVDILGATVAGNTDVLILLVGSDEANLFVATAGAPF